MKFSDLTVYSSLSLPQRDTCRGLAICCRRPCSWTTCGRRWEWPELHPGERAVAKNSTGGCVSCKVSVRHEIRSRASRWSNRLICLKAYKTLKYKVYDSGKLSQRQLFYLSVKSRNTEFRSQSNLHGMASESHTLYLTSPVADLSSVTSSSFPTDRKVQNTDHSSQCCVQRVT